MSSKDNQIKYELEIILANSDSGQQLIDYFSRLPKNEVNRRLYILSQIYPDNRSITDEEYQFIDFLFETKRYRDELNFPQVVRAIGLIDFSQNQKKQLLKQIEKHLDGLAEACTFELDSLLVSLLSPVDLMLFIEKMASDTTSQAVLTHFQDILRYEKWLIDYFSVTKINSSMNELNERSEKI